MTKNRTSMADIAAHAGVSTATVSRVFNGVGQVSEETRRRVLTAIDELGYDRPPSEHTPSTPTIGVIVPELTNPIFASIAHPLQEEISRAGGIALIRTQTPGATSEFDHLSSLIEHRVSGLIFVSGRHADLLSDLSTGDSLGIRAAVTHLHELGHTRIALLTGRTHIVPALRKAEAFTQVMGELIGDHSPIIEETFYTYEAAAAYTHALLERGVTAIVTGSDLQALGAIRTITSLGLSVPEDISDPPARAVDRHIRRARPLRGIEHSRLRPRARRLRLFARFDRAELDGTRPIAPQLTAIRAPRLT